MRLAFDFPFESASVRVFVRDLSVRPDDLDAYLLKLLREADPGAPGDLMHTATSFVTSLGWPATVLRSRRAVAVRYDMLHLVGGAVIVAEDEHALAAEAEPLRATLMSARPDFSGSCACVADLWRGPQST